MSVNFYDGSSLYVSTYLKTFKNGCCQLKIYKNEIFSCYQEIKITHKLWYQLISFLSSCFMCSMGFILFSFLKENTWKLICNVKLFICMYLIEKFNGYIHLKNVFVEIVPPMMQLCQFLWPSPCTRFWTFLMAYFEYQLVDPLGFS